MDINKICPGCMKEVEDRDNVGVCPHCGYNLRLLRAEPHQLQPFTILAGKYLVGKVIGEGGFGISYLGLDLNLELVVAIKEFYPNGFVTRESNHTTHVSLYAGKNQSDVNKWREGFINEAKNLAKFSNLNGIVEVRDFFNENNTAYIVMEYIDGITLKQYLKQNGGKIPADKVFEMMKPVIRSLSKVHDSGMIHRDISPDNIMITKYGGMKLLDFGAAREFAGNAEKSLSIMLKPGYAPEEQYRSHGKQGPWSDVYAVTATIYKCITGTTPLESMERMREDTLKSPKELGIKISDAQDIAIKQGMAVYAEDRLRSMDALYNALYADHNASAPLPVPPPPVNPVVKDTPIKKNPLAEITDAQKKTLLIGGAAVLCVLLLFIGVIGLFGGSSRKEPVPVYEYSQTEEPPQPEEAAVQPVQEEEFIDITAQLNEISSLVSDYNNAEETGMALSRFLELAAEYGNRDDLSGQVNEMYGFYQSAMLERINNCNSQSPNAALYTQISSDIAATLDYAEKFADYGIDVNSEDMEIVRDNIRSDYKERLILAFNEQAESDIAANGSVSRSTLWKIMEGINETDLYPEDDPEDPLRLRYAAALTLHTDSELENYGNDVAGKIQKIYEVIIDADYSPYLIYYLAQLGDSNAYYWYDEFLYSYGGIFFEEWDIAWQRNMVYYYYVEDDFAWTRQSFREYMADTLV